MRDYTIEYLERVTNETTGDLSFITKTATVSAESVVDAINKHFGIESLHFQDMIRLMIGNASDILDII